MSNPYTTDRVRFDSNGDTLVADLFRPIGSRELEPIVVTTGSWTTSKEQQADTYARALAAQGIASMVFDFRGFGQSQGEPRDWENPERKIADLNAAIGFVSGVDWVDPERIGALGVCASAGYQAVNAAADDRVKCLGLVAPWLHNSGLVAPYYGGAEGVAERIALGKQAEATYRESGEVEFMPAVSETDEAAAMYGPYDYYEDPQRGAIPEWDARVAVMSWQPWLEFDPIESGAEIQVPVQIVHSEDGAVPDGAKRFFELLPGEKDIIWTDGTQLDFYDQPRQMAVAVPPIVRHFRKYL